MRLVNIIRAQRYPVQHLVFGQELRRITGEQKSAYAEASST